jgi:putative restriction endonuclease
MKTINRAQELLNAAKNLSVFSKNGQRAPHKPLLLLYALARIQQRKTSPISFEKKRKKLGEIILSFGNAHTKATPENPFWYLKNDGNGILWEIKHDTGTLTGAGGSPSISKMINLHTTGDFPSETRSLLEKDPALLNQVGQIVLNAHFPETIHGDICSAVGFNPDTNGAGPETGKTKKIRDPRFRDEVLQAYGWKCAICGFNIRLGQQSIGLEAAHIKWHQAQGPDKVSNGLSLCSMHHHLFDRGAFSIANENLVIIVSKRASGGTGFNDWLGRFHKTPIARPIHSDYELPERSFVEWHLKEVFQG